MKVEGDEIRLSCRPHTSAQCLRDFDLSIARVVRARTDESSKAERYEGLEGAKGKIVETRGGRRRLRARIRRSQVCDNAKE